MISSGLYWLTSNLSFSSFSSPDCSAIKGDFSPCIDCVCNDNSSQSYFYFSIIDPSLVQLQCAVNCISWRNTILWKWDLQPGRMSSHGPCDPWQHLRVTICVTEINILDFRHHFSPRRKQIIKEHIIYTPCPFSNKLILLFLLFPFQSITIKKIKSKHQQRRKKQKNYTKNQERHLQIYGTMFKSNKIIV